MTFTISKLPPSIYLPQYQNNSLYNWKERLNIIGRCVRSNTHLNRCGQTNLLKLNLFEEKYDTKKFVTIGHNKNIILIPRGYFLYFLKTEFFIFQIYPRLFPLKLNKKCKSLTYYSCALY